MYEAVYSFTRSVVTISSALSHGTEKSSYLLLFHFILKPGSDPVALEASKPFRPQVGLVVPSNLVGSGREFGGT